MFHSFYLYFSSALLYHTIEVSIFAIWSLISLSIVYAMYREFRKIYATANDNPEFSEIKFQRYDYLRVSSEQFNGFVFSSLATLLHNKIAEALL